MNKRIVRIGILILSIAGVAVVAQLFRGTETAADSSYFTAEVQRGPLRNIVNATGAVQTLVTVQVGSQVSGQVEAIYADFNSVVRRGQLLAKLDTRNLELQIDNARASVFAAQARLRSAEAEVQMHAANLQNAQANVDVARVARDNTAMLYERAIESNAQGLVSQNEFDNTKANAESAAARYDQALASFRQVEVQRSSTEAQIEQARASLQQAEAEENRAQVNLEYANIYSPVDGVVISRDVDVGQTIAASMSAPTLFTIATDLQKMQVDASVDEADIGNISEAAAVTFTVDAFPNEVFRGTIAEIRLSPRTVQNVVTYSVILSIDNPGMRLKPGMTANITIIVDQRADALMVSNAALRYRPSGAADFPALAEAADSLPPSATQTAADPEAVFIPLAPGQMWDPADKIRFSSSAQVSERPGTVWVLPANGNPELRDVILGISDGAFTEVVSGNLDVNDVVIVGDSLESSVNPAQPGFSFGLGAGRGR